MKGGVQTVRRLILYLLLFTMVVIAAIGLSGLLGRLLEGIGAVAAEDNAGLAQSLAFTLVAGPLAAVLWWLVWRGSTTRRDNESVSWPVYLVAAYIVSLITFTGLLFSWAASGIAGTWRPDQLAGGIVWALVWFWHRWMWHHASKAPKRLVGVAPAFGWVVALVLSVGGAVFALGALISAAINALSTVSIGPPWWVSPLQSAVWMVAGGALWWWLWNRDGVKSQNTGFFRVMLVFATGFGALALCIYGVATSLYFALRALVDPAGVTSILDTLGLVIAAALLGALVLVHLRAIVLAQPAEVRSATRLVSSGVSLAVAASGFGVSVNALLAALVTTIADTGVRPLLLGGLSALIVGGVAWWVFWRPDATNAESSAGRRIYLVVVFGISAVVALVTLLVIGYQLFVFALDSTSGGSLLDQIRQALGLLTATVLVAVYHFTLWRKHRVAATAPAIGQVILVARGDASDAASAIRAATGARVTLWQSASPGSPPDTAALLAALDGIAADRVLLIAEGSPHAIALQS